MVIVIGCVAGIEVVQEGERSKVKREAEETSVVRIEDAVSEGIRLPGSDGFGVTSGNGPVKASISVFFGTCPSLNSGFWDAGRGLMSCLDPG